MVASSRSGITRATASGFTLIELLLATSLLMLILGMAMYGYQLFNQQWQRNLSNIDTVFSKAQRYDMLSEALQGIVPYLVNSTDASSFYFLGRTNGFTAITISPIINVGNHAVIRVFAEPADNNTYQLVYEEASLHNTFLIDASQLLPFNDRIIIVENMKSIDFSYYVKEFSEQDSDFGTAVTKGNWHPEHDSLLLATHPENIIINLAGFPLHISVAQRTSALSSRATTEFY